MLKLTDEVGDDLDVLGGAVVEARLVFRREGFRLPAAVEIGGEDYGGVLAGAQVEFGAVTTVSVAVAVAGGGSGGGWGSC